MPALAIAAPAMPATSACDELVGSAEQPGDDVPDDRAHQPAEHDLDVDVRRCRPAPCRSSRRPSVPKTNAATKLKNAAHATACVGDSTRVETIVAIELAASWKPFRKSKTSATKMMKRMRVSMRGESSVVTLRLSSRPVERVPRRAASQAGQSWQRLVTRSSGRCARACSRRPRTRRSLPRCSRTAPST